MHRTALSWPERAAVWLGAGVAIALGAPTASGAEPTAIDCPTASEQGQRLRDDGKYLRARDMFRHCSRDACPGVVRKDCIKWLSGLEDSVPTIGVSAHDAEDRDVGAVKVIVDGDTLATRLDGRPMAVDPGEHAVRFETEGMPPVEMRVIIQVGEKNRLVKVQFHPARAVVAPIATPPDKPVPTTEIAAPKSVSSWSPPIAAFVLGGAGVLALGSFAFFGVTGKGDLNELKSTCAPYCAQSALDAAKTKLTVADVSLAVGVVSLGVAAVMLLTGSKADARRTTHLDLGPAASGHGAMVGMGAAF